LARADAKLKLGSPPGIISQRMEIPEMVPQRMELPEMVSQRMGSQGWSYRWNYVKVVAHPGPPQQLRQPWTLAATAVNDTTKRTTSKIASTFFIQFRVF
jgi:hypothetical protein